VTSIINGEFSFTLKEKTDRNKQRYLFGGIHLINCVLFVRPAGTGPDGLPRWQAVLKPYRPQEAVQDPDPDAAAWEEDDSSEPVLNSKERKR